MNEMIDLNVKRAATVAFVAGALLLAAVAASGGVAAADGSAGDDADDGGANVTDTGPPSDLPEPVPDFVGDLLGTIDDFLSGLSDALGAIDVTPGGERP